MPAYKDIFTGEQILSDAFTPKEVDGAIYEYDTSAETLKLEKASLDQGSYLNHLKAYLKKLQEKLESTGAAADEKAAFEKAGREYAQKYMTNFDKYELYTGPSKNLEGMVILQGKRDDGSPYVSVWKHGLSE